MVMAAWYPPYWPFFLAGITHRLFRRVCVLRRTRPPPGRGRRGSARVWTLRLFACHSSHLGILGRVLVPVADGGLMLLAGYFQSALYGFFALGVCALADLWLERRPWTRTLAIVAGMPAPS